MAKADAWGAPGKAVFARRGAARRKFGLAGNTRLFAEPTYRKLLAAEPWLRRLIPTLIVVFLLVVAALRVLSLMNWHDETERNAKAMLTLAAGQLALAGADKAEDRQELLDDLARRSALGVDAGGYRIEVQKDQGQPTATYVTASQILDGQLTGVQWSFTLVADGVQSLYGSIAPVVDLGAYSLISPADAVKRLGDPRFDSGYGRVMPLATDSARGAASAGTSSGTASSGVATAAPEPTVPATPTAGESIPWPVQTVTLTASRLGLGMTTLESGAVLLLPSYELSNAEGSTWSVIAVTDDRLDFSPSR